VLDFLLQGQQSPFVLGREHGYYTAQGVNLAAFDPGSGGADSITKVAIEFNAKNSGRELIAVLLIYDQATAVDSREMPAVKKAVLGAGISRHFERGPIQYACRPVHSNSPYERQGSQRLTRILG